MKNKTKHHNTRRWEVRLSKVFASLRGCKNLVPVIEPQKRNLFLKRVDFRVARLEALQVLDTRALRLVPRIQLFTHL